MICLTLKYDQNYLAENSKTSKIEPNKGTVGDIQKHFLFSKFLRHYKLVTNLSTFGNIGLILPQFVTNVPTLYVIYVRTACYLLL